MGLLEQLEDDEYRDNPRAQKMKLKLVNLGQEPPSVVGIIEDVLDDGRIRKNFFRPSMLHGCNRANVFHYRDVRRSPQQVPNQLQRILDNGTAVHEVLQKYLGQHSDYWFVSEAKVDREIEGARVRGSCDGIVIRRRDLYRWGIEIKSINADDFKILNKVSTVEELLEFKDTKKGAQSQRLKDLINKVLDHCGQATIYARLNKVEWITLLYWNKNSQAIHEFHVRADDERWEVTKKRIRLLYSYVQKRTLPKYDPSTCSTIFCAFVSTCRKAGAPV